MTRILDIASKDLRQLLRERSVFLFLLIMPVAFTLLIGYASGGFSRTTDPRIPIGYLDLDSSRMSRVLHDILADSEVIRLQENILCDQACLEAQVSGEKMAAAVIVPKGYGHALLFAKPERLILIGDSGTTVGMSVESELISSVLRLESAVRTAAIMEDLIGDQLPFDYSMEKALNEWKEPPIRVTETTSAVIPVSTSGASSMAQISPGMMLQFAVAGLLTSAQILVAERKTRALQRMLTTATTHLHILMGHFLAIFVLTFCQFVLLLIFGQVVLRVDYLRVPGAILLVAFSAALCIAALGLLIGVFAKSEEQAIIFSLVPMFVLGGLGGTMAPLEITGPTFQAIGHASPLAWAMDGFKNITVRGYGFASALTPSAVLLGYAVLFFTLATWRFRRVAV